MNTLPMNVLTLENQSVFGGRNLFHGRGLCFMGEFWNARPYGTFSWVNLICFHWGIVSRGWTALYGGIDKVSWEKKSFETRQDTTSTRRFLGEIIWVHGVGFCPTRADSVSWKRILFHGSGICFMETDFVSWGRGGKQCWNLASLRLNSTINDMQW